MPNLTTTRQIPSPQALIKALPLNEIVGLCRLAYNLPVRASDVPSGVPGLSREDVQELLNHIGWTVVNGTYRPEVPEVMGAAEVAAELDVKQQNIRILKGMPKPIGQLRSTALWDACEVRLFAAARRKRKANEHRKG